MKCVSHPASAIFLATATAAHAAGAPHYNVQALPPNTLLNNYGLIAAPAPLLQSNIAYLSVNDAGEFAGTNTGVQFGQTMATTTFVWLPAPAHELPAGFTVSTGIFGPGGNAAINDQGQTAGTIGEIPYFWAPESVPGITAGLNHIPTSTVQPGTDPWAFSASINDAGQVIGYDMLYPGRIGGFTPFIWSPIAVNGLPAGVTYLPAVPVIPNAINNRGDVLVGAYLFLSKPGGGLTPGLHAMPIAGADINDDMQVVGGSQYWSPSTGLLDLNTLIPANSGWTLTHAAQINNRGDIIGTGTFNGQPSSFFLSVPEPAIATMSIFALIAGSCVARRPRRKPDRR